MSNIVTNSSPLISGTGHTDRALLISASVQYVFTSNFAEYCGTLLRVNKQGLFTKPSNMTHIFCWGGAFKSQSGYSREWLKVVTYLHDIVVCAVLQTLGVLIASGVI